MWCLSKPKKTQKAVNIKLQKTKNGRKALCKTWDQRGYIWFN